MPKRIAPLSELQVRNAKPKTKQTTLFDGQVFGYYEDMTTADKTLDRMRNNPRDWRIAKIRPCLQDQVFQAAVCTHV